VESQRVDHMIHEPVGMHPRASFTRITPKYHVVKHRHLGMSSVRSIRVIRPLDDDGGGNANSVQPLYLLVTSERGVVKLVSSVNGQPFGEMHSPSEDLVVDKKALSVDSKSWNYIPDEGQQSRVFKMERFIQQISVVRLKTLNSLEEDEGGQSGLPGKKGYIGGSLDPNSIKERASGIQEERSVGVLASPYEEWQDVLPVKAIKEEGPLVTRKGVQQYMAEQKRTMDALLRKKAKVQEIWSSKVRFCNLQAEQLRTQDHLAAGINPGIMDAVPAELKVHSKDRSWEVSMSAEGRRELLGTLSKRELFPDSIFSGASANLQTAHGTEIAQFPPVDGLFSASSSDMIVKLPQLPHVRHFTKKKQMSTSIGKFANKIDDIIQAIDDINIATTNPRPQTSGGIPSAQVAEVRETYERAMKAITAPMIRPKTAKATEKQRAERVMRDRLGYITDKEVQRRLKVEALEAEHQLKNTRYKLPSTSRGKYGPYSITDIINFCGFLIEVQLEPLSFYYAEDESAYKVLTLLGSRQVQGHMQFKQDIDSLTSHPYRSSINKIELIQVLFQHATRAERGRVNTVSRVCQCMWIFLDALRPPAAQVSSSSPIHTSMFKDERARVVISLDIPPRCFDPAIITSTRSLEGWAISRRVLLDVYFLMNLLMRSQDGTAALREMACMLTKYPGAGTLSRHFDGLMDEVRVTHSPDGDLDGMGFLSVCSALKLRYFIP
jgi:hypothetical protein